ncbi:MAG: ABC transporter permease [Deinococcus sp.]|nr:ABC transporter permease [Deinococcus sp.]
MLRRLSRNHLAVMGLIIALLVGLSALAAPWLAPAPPKQVNLGAYLAPPGPGHLLGADDLGRDILSRILYGARLSLWIGLVGMAVALAIGVPIGLVAGFLGSLVDSFLMRFTDMVLAMPFILLAIALAAALGPSVTNSYIALGLATWPYVARIVRGQVLAVRELDFVQAARALGGNNLRIMLRHVLPNVLAPIMVFGTARLAQNILAESALSFLGLGAQPPEPSWGAMLYAGRSFLRTAPWLSFFPGLAIFLTVLGFNLLGDGLRDALDVRLR